MKHIDVEKILKEDNPKIYKKSPRFVINFFKKILHEDELNELSEFSKDHHGIDYLPKVIKYFNIKIDVKGLDNFPENGRCMFTANHHLGFLDGTVFAYLVSQRYNALKVIGNEAFAYVPNMRPILASVNVFGKNSREYIDDLRKLYASDVPINTFPAGIVARIENGKIQDKKWTKSFIARAIANKRDVVPVMFFEKNSRFFYNLYRIRTFFGIKINLELTFLMNEIFKRKNSTVKVKIGKPIPWQTFDKSKTHVEWAQEVRKHVYKLEHNNSNIKF